MHNSAHLFNPTTSHWPIYPSHNYPAASQFPPVPSAPPAPSLGLTSASPTSCQQIGRPRSPSYTNTAPSIYRGNVSALPAYSYANSRQATLPLSPYSYPSLRSSGPYVVPSAPPSLFLATETNSGFTGSYPTRLANFSTPGLETILIAILVLVALDLVVVRPHKYAAISERR